MAERVNVWVKPGSSRGPFIELDADGTLIVFVRERAVDGAANVAVVKIVAAHFGVSPSRVSIRRGHSSRRKTLEVVR